MLTHPAPGQLRRVTDSASVLLASNPGRMTLDGTNSWVLRAPGRRGIVVVDPGPSTRSHLRQLAEVGDVELVLITHRHVDHTAGIEPFVQQTGAPVRAVASRFCRSAQPLKDGEIIDAAGLSIQVLASPGHTADSVSFVLPDAVLTGDSILGRGTSVLDARDGDLGAYLETLERLRAVGAGKAVLPGHGSELDDTAAAAQQYLEHRHERLALVRRTLEELGPNASAWQVVRRAYRDVDKRLWPAALSSVKIQLKYLRA